MTDYSKFKVTELKEQLSQKGLSTVGKKEELIARLTAAASSKDTASNGTKDDDPGSGVKQVGAGPPTAGPTVEKKEVKLSTTTETSIDTDPVEDKLGERKKFTFKRLADDFDQSEPSIKPAEQAAKVSMPTEEKTIQETESGETESFSAGIASSKAEVELEKRKARAARFGVPVSDTVKALERAQRFATSTDDTSKESSTNDKTVKALDQALGANKGKKRGPDTRIQNDAKKSKDGAKASSATKAVLLDPTEKAKADARAKRFGGIV